MNKRYRKTESDKSERAASVRRVSRGGKEREALVRELGLGFFD